MSMDPISQLIAERDCRSLVLRAADAVDHGDAAGLAACFTREGVLVRPDGSHLVGQEAIQAVYASRPADRLTQHLISNHSVHVQAIDRALSVCRVLLYTGRFSDPSSPKGRPADPMVQVGEIRDELVHTDEGWRIRQRQAHFVLYSAPAV